MTIFSVLLERRRANSLHVENSAYFVGFRYLNNSTSESLSA